MGVYRFLAARLLLVVPTLLILLTAVFILLRAIGDPITAMVGMRVPPQVLQQMREQAGLTAPLWLQYIRYLAGIFRGDFGVTMAVDHRPVLAVIQERFPATLELTLGAFLMSLLLGIALGSLAAWRGKNMDSGVRLFGIVSYALFIPWLGLTLQLLFGVYLRILPTGLRADPGLSPPTLTGLYTLDSLLAGRPDMLLSALRHLLLPSLTLGLVLSGAFTRLVRNNLKEMLAQDFALAYRARGVDGLRLWTHALKNALIPIITLAGLQFAILLTGAILTETTFSWPGLGTMIVERIQYTDYTAVQGAIVFFAIFVVFVNALVDVIYALADPRVSY
ncbi:MAG: peptide ABC transporter permease [Nitrososphaerota archaeon]